MTRNTNNVTVNGDLIREEIKNAGASVAKLAKELGVSEAQFRVYLSRNAMPAHIYHGYRMLMFEHRKMVWMRIGVKVPIPEEELFDILSYSEREHIKEYKIRGFSNYNLSREESYRFLQDAVADGDSYIPSDCLDEYRDWFQDQINQRQKARRTRAEQSTDPQ